jgi:tetratricopeptide (TPR) repeat protein
LFAEFFGPEHEAGRKLAASALERSGSYAKALTALETAPPAGARESAVRILPVLVAGRSVRAWQEEFALKDRVLQRVREDSTQPAVVREWMQEFAAQMREDPDQLNEASWAVASQPGRSPAAYALALAQAEKACRLETNHARLNTLGVAQFRAGQFEQALSTLLKAQSQNPRDQESPSDVAFIALTQFRLGQIDAARRNLAQLREHVKEQSQDEEAVALLREVESVITGAEK